MEAMVVLLYGDEQCLLLFFRLCRGVVSFFFKGVAAGKESGGRLPAVADQWSCCGGRR
jgi:hypothetical protein